jgi:hypothetical protein
LQRAVIVGCTSVDGIFEEQEAVPAVINGIPEGGGEVGVVV